VRLPLAAVRAEQAKPAGSGLGRVASGKQVP
jgi:hypothetical protein